MTLLLTIAIMLTTPPDQSGYATRFGPGPSGKPDPHAGGKALCLRRRLTNTDWGVATRRGKCGDLFLLRNPRNGKWVIAPRVDSGPWRAYPRRCYRDCLRTSMARHPRFFCEIECRFGEGKTMVGLRRGYTYGRNALDATYPVMKALGVRGMGPVQVWRLR